MLTVTLPSQLSLKLQFRAADEVYLCVGGLKVPISKAEAWELMAGEAGSGEDEGDAGGGKLSPAEKRGLKVRAAFRAKFEAGQCRQCGKKRLDGYAYCRAHLILIRARLAKARAAKAKAKSGKA